jgi:hypothetical protein
LAFPKLAHKLLDHSFQPLNPEDRKKLSNRSHVGNPALGCCAKGL